MGIVVSFVIAFLLALVPIPEWAEMYRPDWVILVLIYWCLDSPDRVGAGTGWIIGLMVDIAQANLLGMNALGMTVVGYLANQYQPRLRAFPWWQQAVCVLIILVLYRALVGWIRGFVSPVYLGYEYWIPCVTGMVVWPWLYYVMHEIRRAARTRSLAKSAARASARSTPRARAR